MSVFMRTPSGLRNYAKFHSAEITVYIEGKCEPNSTISDDRVTYDELYYRAILRDVADKHKFVFKVVGCKDAVAAYAQQIRDKDIKNCFTIVDRDWEGLISSWLPDPRLVYTYGYSWENDLWSFDLLMQTLRDLLPTIRRLDQDAVGAMVDRAAHRLARISKVDCITKLHGIKFIPSNKNTVGVDLHSSSRFLVNVGDIKKYGVRARSQRKVIRSCPLSKAMHSSIRNEPSEKIIRGHLWEFACIYIASYFYRLFSGEKSVPRNVVKGAAFNAFSQGASRFLSPRAAMHYRTSIDAAIAATST